MSKNELLPTARELPPTLARFRTYGSESAAGNDKSAVYDALRGRLLFKSGSTFNDPFEGKPHYVPAFADRQKQRYILGKYLGQLARAAKFPSPNKWVEQEMRAKTTEQLTQEFIEMSKGINYDYGHLLCLMHPDTIATPLPWSHYADSHRGVCIEFDTAIPPVRFAMPIKYSNEYPSLKVPSIASDVSDEMNKAFLAKALDWEYEREFRVLRTLGPELGESGHLFVDWEGNLAITRSEVAKRLTLGARMPKAFRDEIVDWTRANARHVEVFQADLHPSKYEVIRAPVT